MRRLFYVGIVAVGMAGCGADGLPHDARSAVAREFTFQPIAELDDGDQRILARPEWVSILPDDRIVVADISDKNLKVYDAAGLRLQTVGRVGHGPGEFVGLTTGQTYLDTLVGYDMNGSRLSFFGPDGRFARDLVVPRRNAPPTYHIRVVDDSLFLLIGAVPGGAGKDLLSLVRADGTPVATFFNPAAYLGRDPKLIQRTGVVADGAQGVVFAALVGGDSVYAFDYSGRRLGAGLADAEESLITTRTLLERNGGKDRTADGHAVTHGNRNVIGLVALDSATVALQIARYDAVRGTDPLDGGTMVVATLLPDGSVVPIVRTQVEGALLGRDRKGQLLVLQYAGPEGESYRLTRMVLGAAEGAVQP